MDLPPDQAAEPITETPPEIHGFPAWIKAVVAIVALLVVFALTRIGPMIGAAISAEKGQRDLAAGQYGRAADELAPVVAKYPKATSLLLDLVQSEIGADRPQDAAETLVKLEGREVSKEDSERADQLANQLEQMIPKDSK